MIVQMQLLFDKILTVKIMGILYYMIKNYMVVVCKVYSLWHADHKQKKWICNAFE